MLQQCLKKRPLKASGLIEELQGDMKNAVKVLKAQMADIIASITKDIDDLKAKIVVLERAVANGGPTHKEAARIRVPEPKPYNGARDAKELENFLWQVEQYFKAVRRRGGHGACGNHVPHGRRNAVVAPAARGDIEKGLVAIDTWEDLKRELFFNSFPRMSSTWPARALSDSDTAERSGSMSFTTLMLDITDLFVVSEKDQLFYFMDGLQPWAEQELHRRGVQDLATALAEAERLVDYSHKQG